MKKVILIAAFSLSILTFFSTNAQAHWGYRGGGRGEYGYSRGWEHRGGYYAPRAYGYAPPVYCAPRPVYRDVWIPGHWRRDYYGDVWVEGHWSRQRCW